jgi:AcrR family transcriptional regulator
MSRAQKRRRGRPPGRRSEETRLRILRAAEREFAALGYDGTRTVAIARRAGLTHAMLHYYFDTKAELYREVLERVFGQLAFHLRAAVARAAIRSPRVALRHLLAVSQAVLARDPHFVRIMLWEVAAGAPRLDAVAGPFFDGLARVVQRSGRRGLVRPPHDARDVAVTLQGALLLYFAADPLVMRLFGRARFGPSACRRRSEHLAVLVDSMLVSGQRSEKRLLRRMPAGGEERGRSRERRKASGQEQGAAREPRHRR